MVLLALTKYLFKYLKSKICIILLIICFSSFSSSFGFADKPQSQLPLERIEIHPVGHVSLKTHIHSFCVEIADEPEEWTTGLMFRRSLNPKSGMLFLYPSPKQHTMWMKNTSVSLDMIFIDQSGVIVKIAENTTPFSHDVIGPQTPVTAVLELIAGSTKKYGFKKGDTVHHKVFGQNLPKNCSL